MNKEQILKLFQEAWDKAQEELKNASEDGEVNYYAGVSNGIAECQQIIHKLAE